MTTGGHLDAVRLIWEGNAGEGTAEYAGYSRRHRVVVPGKPDLAGSADTAFRGEPDRHDPEDLFLASIATCHMLFYLALCARHGVRVLSYEDCAEGNLSFRPDGGGAFESVMLSPAATIESERNSGLALKLHDVAHDRCFVANSCRIPIRLDPTVEIVR